MHPHLQTLGFRDYDDYLSSDKWKSRRLKYSKTHPEHCFVCEKASNCCLHHLTYDHLGFELDEDLIWLCRKHHQKIHNVVNGKVHIPIPSPKAHIEMRAKWLERKANKVKHPLSVKQRHSVKSAKRRRRPVTNAQIIELRRLGMSSSEIPKLSSGQAQMEIRKRAKTGPKIADQLTHMQLDRLLQLGITSESVHTLTKQEAAKMIQEIERKKESL